MGGSPGGDVVPVVEDDPFHACLALFPEIGHTAFSFEGACVEEGKGKDNAHVAHGKARPEIHPGRPVHQFVQYGYKETACNQFAVAAHGFRYLGDCDHGRLSGAGEQAEPAWAVGHMGPMIYLAAGRVKGLHRFESPY